MLCLAPLSLLSIIRLLYHRSGLLELSKLIKGRIVTKTAFPRMIALTRSNCRFFLRSIRITLISLLRRFPIFLDILQHDILNCDLRLGELALDRLMTLKWRLNASSLRYPLIRLIVVWQKLQHFVSCAGHAWHHVTAEFWILLTRLLIRLQAFISRVALDDMGPQILRILILHACRLVGETPSLLMLDAHFDVAVAYDFVTLAIGHGVTVLPSRPVPRVSWSIGCDARRLPLITLSVKALNLKHRYRIKHLQLYWAFVVRRAQSRHRGLLMVMRFHVLIHLRAALWAPWWSLRIN